jgi:hypothetical protein
MSYAEDEGFDGYDVEDWVAHATRADPQLALVAAIAKLAAALNKQRNNRGG